MVMGISSTSAQISPSTSAPVCYDFGNYVLPQKILPEKKKFDDQQNTLTQQSDVSTPYLIEQGVKNIRIYHAKLEQFCDEIVTCEKKDKVDQSALNQNMGNCVTWIDDEVRKAKSRLSELMVNDVNRKKVQFLVNKYQEMNQKFRSLLDVMTFIKGKMDAMLSNVGPQCVKVQGPEGS